MAAEYRAYALGSDGHIVSRIDLICDNDIGAKERARQLVDDRPIELWRGERFLGLFEPVQARPIRLGFCKGCNCSGFVGAGSDPYTCARTTCRHPIKDHE